jgi:hypothetical protein
MNTIQRFTACLTLVLLAACNTSLPAETVTPAFAPQPTSLPTQVPVLEPTQTSTATLPLYQRVTLTSTTASESGKAPDYTFKTQVPVLQGGDPRVEKFNSGVNTLVKGAVDQFRQELAQQPATPLAGGSFFDLRYKVLSPPGNIISLQIIIEGMSDGAAHPYHVTLAYNYDLEKGQEITFNQLFLHGVNALQVIADYCKTELAKRDIGFEGFAAGAEPTVENYAIWNLNAQGLVIVFNEYQVAPYVAGPQSVTVPFDALNKIIDPAGPLATLRP